MNSSRCALFVLVCLCSPGAIGAQEPSLGLESKSAPNFAEPLPVDKAFVVEAIAAGPNEVLVRFSMPKGYYLYRDKTSFNAGNATLAAPRWPPGKPHDDANFGKTTVYYDQADVPIEVTHAPPAGQPLKLTTTLQGCLENFLCYPPSQRRIEVMLRGAAPTSERR